MFRTTSLAIAIATAASALPSAAQAAVTYDLAVTAGNFTGSGFSLTVPAPITAGSTTFGAAALSSCNIVNSVNPGPLTCVDVVFERFIRNFDLSLDLTHFSVWIDYDPFGFTAFTFDAGAFDNNGLHYGVNQNGVSAALTVSGILEDIGDPPIDIPAGVPEPASWALMIAGFALAGAGLRRRGAMALRIA